MELKAFSNFKAVLAEGPVYDYELNRLFWVDIYGRKVITHDFNTEEEKFYDTPDVVTSLCVIDEKRIITTLRHGFYFLNLDSGKLYQIYELKNDEKNRFNDGKCDIAGRYWAGTMNLNEADPEPTGSLYKFSNNNLTRMLDGLYLSNGLGWSPDNSVFYLIDTPLRQVFAFDFDKDKGEIFNKRVAVDFKDEPGRPDGMTVDEEGFLWIAHSGGGKVSRWNPNNGEKVFEIKLPVRDVSSVTFGGKEMNQLFITTMSRSGEPQAGMVFTAKVNVKGLKSYRFKGSFLHFY